MSRRKEPERLALGDRVWYLKDSYVQVAEISEVRRYLEDEPKNTFALYALKLSRDREVKVAHRSELFKAPTERHLLMDEVESLRDMLRHVAEDLEEQEPDHIPKIGDDC